MPDATDLPPLQAGNVRIDIRVEDAGGDTKIVRLSLAAEARDLGAYQGRLVFDPRQLRVVECTTPDDNLRLVNTDNAGVGEIRFAGIAATAFDSPVVLELRAAVADSFDPTALRAELAVVGDVLGTQVGREDIAPPTLMIVR